MSVIVLILAECVFVLLCVGLSQVGGGRRDVN